MSLTIVQHGPHASVRVGGSHDFKGELGHVLLHVEFGNGLAQLKPAEARKIARALLRFADFAARQKSREGK